MRKNKSIKSLFKSLTLPVTILVILIFFSYFSQWLPIPSPEDLINKTIQVFGELKWWAVFLIALVEGFLFLGQYFPGGVIVFFSIISAGKDLGRISLLILIISIAFVIAYTLNYVLGRYGIYTIFTKLGFKKSIDKSKKKVKDKAFKAIALTYEDPNIASITATAAGIVHLPFKKFLLFSSIWALVWNIFWAAVIYFLGEATLNLVGINYIFFIIFAWIFILVLKHFFSKK